MLVIISIVGILWLYLKCNRIIFDQYANIITAELAWVIYRLRKFSKRPSAVMLRGKGHEDGAGMSIYSIALENWRLKTLVDNAIIFGIDGSVRKIS